MFPIQGLDAFCKWIQLGINYETVSKWSYLRTGFGAEAAGFKLGAGGSSSGGFIEQHDTEDKIKDNRKKGQKQFNYTI